MKNTNIARHYGAKPLTGKRGTNRVELELVDKAKDPSGLEKLTRNEELRLPCVDAVHRFGKKSGST